ncbi:MAG: GGDEF domain-containing protein [Ruminiclostridium sp.]|nr:GGDEF domain-containing protein [Ruminiclostridium sp.]
MYLSGVITFDICAFTIFSFVLVACFFRRMTHGKTNRIFIVLTSVCLLDCVFDIAAIIADSLADPSLGTLQFTMHSLYLFFHNIITPLYLLYAVAQTDTFHLFGKNRVETCFFWIPTGALAIAFIVNCFTGMIFTIEDGVYHRQPFINVLYIIAGIFALSCVGYLLLYRHLFTKTKLIALLSSFPLLSVAVCIQYLDRALRIEMFALSLGLLFISTFIQRPEAYIDFNTGVYKFNAYAHDMKQSFSNSKPVDVIMVNIANFLQIQEILSYDSTNDLLRLVANRLVSIVKQSKTDSDIYYLDKGRFRIVVNYNDHHKTEYTAETINAALKPKMPLNGMELNLVAYVCVARCPEEIDNFNTLIEFGKDLSTKFPFSGKLLHAGELLDKSRYNLMGELEKILSDAVLNKKFEVYYQPIFNIAEGRFRSAEALVRLYDDKYGFISPELFIPVSEKTGDIHKIGMFVFEEVCRFIASDDFKRLGLNYIEVNLSIVQCMQGGLAGDLLSVMKKYGVSPEQINLEITESADSNTQNIIAENMSSLLNAGITFSLDDFGTGYSNMQRMASLPLKIVKLDKTFTNFDSNPRLMAVLQNIIKMLKDMDMEIVVEGVESQELVDRFSTLKCEYIQGYFYSRPLPKDQFIIFIENSIPKPEPVYSLA